MIVTTATGAGLVFFAGVAVPAYAEASVDAQLPAPQIISVAPTADMPVIERDGYTVTAPPPVQWPTVNHTKISDGYGPRVPPCDGCSSFHEGVDFDAGWGAEVHAIAAGIVIETDDPFNGSLGTHVTIQHLVDGQTVTSLYGHMQAGSMTLRVGDQVHVGQTIGLVGSTGASTGPHLHLEIRVEGAHVNPLSWLRAHIG